MKKKIRIMHFPVRDTKGGVTKYAINNWSKINKKVFQFDFAAVNASAEFEDEISKTGANFYYIGCTAEKSPQKFCNELYNILSNGKYDIVHLHTSMWKSTLAERVAKEAGIKRIIIHAHSTSIFGSSEEARRNNLDRHNKIVETITPDIATDYWACSTAAAQFLYGNKIPQSIIRIMPNAIDITRYAYDSCMREIIRDEMKLKDNFVIGHVGRFAYPKNQEFLLGIVKKLVGIIPTIKLVLVGDGENRGKCESYVAENGLQNHVVFTGYREDTENLLQAFDVFTLPSLFEGVSIALIEAQAAGLTCLASNRVYDDVNITGNVKFLPLNVETWCGAIETSYKSRIRQRFDTLQQIREAGYDIQRQIKEVEKGYLGEL